MNATKIFPNRSTEKVRSHFFVLTFVCLFVLLFFNSEVRAAPDTKKVLFSFTSFNANNLHPVKAILDDDWRYRINQDADYGVSQTQFELGYQFNQWQVGVGSRIEHYLVTNSDSAKLYKYSKTQFPQSLATQGTSFDLDIQYKMLRARKLWLAHLFEYGHNLRITNKFNYWDPRAFRESKLVGLVNYDGATTGLATMEESYTHKNLLKRPDQKNWNNGQGFSWDLFLHWQISKNTMVSIDLINLFNQVDFDGVGYSKGELNSSTTYRDEQGILRFNPNYRGVEQEITQRLRMPTEQKTTVSYASGSLQYFLEHHNHHLTTTTKMGISKYARWADSEYKLELAYEARHSALHLGVSNEWLSLAMMSDDINLSEAEVLELTLYAKFRF